MCPGPFKIVGNFPLDPRLLFPGANIPSSQLQQILHFPSFKNVSKRQKYFPKCLGNYPCSFLHPQLLAPPSTLPSTPSTPPFILYFSLLALPSTPPSTHYSSLHPLLLSPPSTPPSILYSSLLAPPSTPPSFLYSSLYPLLLPLPSTPPSTLYSSFLTFPKKCFTTLGQIPGFKTA